MANPERRFARLLRLARGYRKRAERAGDRAAMMRAAAMHDEGVRAIYLARAREAAERAEKLLGPEP